MDIFGALADPVRRSLLAELAGGPRRVVDLAASRPISRPAVSKHLRLLREAGAVTVDRRGRERYYALDRAALAPVASYVAGLAAARPSASRRWTPWRPRSAGPPASGGTAPPPARGDRMSTPTGRIEQRDGQHVLVQTREFRAPIEDVWAAVTEPDRLARWIGVVDR